MPYEGTSKSYKKMSGKMSSMSGADDAVYAEFRRNSGVKHPLFKKFRK
jgi:DNA excision repair protein ERCC-3